MIASWVFSILLVFYLTNEIKKRREAKLNIPEEDEMSKRHKMMAGNKAFHASLILWLVIFFLNDIIDKNERIIGIGVLGSGLIYGVYLWYYRLKGTRDE